MLNTDHSAHGRKISLASVVVVGVCALWGGFARRWMSDDGLIVLRTVRNLEAGNGPVFNAGERVEANTSTLWQYLIYFGRVITHADLEGIAIYLGLALGVAAMVIGTWATSSLVERAHLVAPAGALVYLALPPARDFFTSGLEWGLSIFYLAVLWWLAVRWVQARARSEEGSRARHSARAPRDLTPLALAWWTGMSWLVRPELALYGAVFGLLLLVTHRNWKSWLAIFAAALPLPLAYQIFRMGYYGLLTPHTAVAKSASDAAWGSGFQYLGDFVAPYALYLPWIGLLALAGWIYRDHLRPSGIAHLRSHAVIAYAIWGTALLHVIYVLRVGGDFMHGRMLLLPLFAMLLPVFVLPLRTWLAVGASAACALWALVVVLRGHPVAPGAYDGAISVVDERDFWTSATLREPGNAPKNAEDFRHSPAIRGFADGVAGLERGDGFAYRYVVESDPYVFDWTSVRADPQRTDPPTLYFINLGMTSMNAPLDVRVLDNIGLATPLAARQPRDPDARIGHDKDLAAIWQAADSPADLSDLPSWIDKEEVEKARTALQGPEFQELFATFRSPLTGERFWENVKFSLSEGRELALSSDPDDYLRN